MTREVVYALVISRKPRVELFILRLDAIQKLGVRAQRRRLFVNQRRQTARVQRLLDALGGERQIRRDTKPTERLTQERPLHVFSERALSEQLGVANDGVRSKTLEQ